MSHWQRIQYSLIGTTANGAQAVIYYQLFKQEIMVMATGEYSGQFTPAIHNLATWWIAEIVILQFAIMAFLLYGPIREQKGKRPVVRR